MHEFYESLKKNSNCSRRVDGSIEFERREIWTEVWPTQTSKVNENHILLSSWHSVWRSDDYRSGSRLHKVKSEGVEEQCHLRSRSTSSTLLTINFHDTEWINEIVSFMSFQRQELQRLMERVCIERGFFFLNKLLSNCVLTPAKFSYLTDQNKQRILIENFLKNTVFI